MDSQMDFSDCEGDLDHQKGEAWEPTADPEAASPKQTLGQLGPDNDSENETDREKNATGELFDNKTNEQEHESEATTCEEKETSKSQYSNVPEQRKPLQNVTDEEAGNQHMMCHKDEVQDRHNDQSLLVQWHKVVPIAVSIAVAIFVSSYIIVESWPAGTLSAGMGSDPNLRDHLVADFLGRLEELRERFPSQSNRFWRKVEVSTRRVLGDRNPLQPATFLMPVSDENLVTTTCLLERLSEAITASYQAKPANHINVTTMVNEDSPDVVKRSIDHTLLNSLGSGSKVSVIHHLEKIPLSAALIFQGYCDNENARFKDSVFFYAVYLSAQPVPEDDASVEKKMREMWSADPAAQGYMPLMGRIVKNIVYVRPEDSGILNRECSIRV